MTKTRTQTILIVEDSPSLALTYKEYLKRESYAVITEETVGKRWRAQAISPRRDRSRSAFAGYGRLGNSEAIPRRLPELARHCRDGRYVAQTALTAMNNGAFDFILKPFSPRGLRDLAQCAGENSLGAGSSGMAADARQGTVTDLLASRPPCLAFIAR